MVGTLVSRECVPPLGKGKPAELARRRFLAVGACAPGVQHAAQHLVGTGRPAACWAVVNHLVEAVCDVLGDQSWLMAQHGALNLSDHIRLVAEGRPKGHKATGLRPDLVTNGAHLVTCAA